MLIFGENIKDPNTPFRVISAEKLKPILEIMPDDFFLSNVIISTFVINRKAKHLWLQITFKNRQGGVNSINLKRIIKIGYKAIADFYNVKQKTNK